MAAPVQKINKNKLFIIEQFKKGHKYAILRGGTRSGKTWSSLETIFLGGMGGVFELCSIVGPTIPHLKRGALRDFLKITAPYIKSNLITYKETDKTFKFWNGAIVEFFSTDSPDRLRGAGRDWLFINEANTHPVEAFDELTIRTLKFVMIDFNPTARFWLNDRFEQMNLDISQYEIVTTYKDNPYLPKEMIRDIERRQAIDEWWRVYGLGEYGELSGTVIFNYNIIDFAIPEPEIIGIDFGEGRSPSAIVGARRYGDSLQAWEIAYGNLSLTEMAQVLQQYECTMVADSAQKDLINILRRSNISVYPCKKYTLVASYHLLNKVGVTVHAGSRQLIKEIKGLEWADKGRGLLKVGCSDHAVDALRYLLHEVA